MILYKDPNLGYYFMVYKVIISHDHAALKK
jgi:hypothetical protein